MVVKIFVLLYVFQIKHFVADYLLQNKYMLGKFKPGIEYALPLAAHCAVHCLFTLVIGLVFIQPFDGWLLYNIVFIDFIYHFIMDRIKASPRLLGMYHALNKRDYQTYSEWEKNEWGEDLFRQTTSDQREELKSMAIRRLKENHMFWLTLGVDQLVHHCTHYLIIYKIVSL